MAPVEARAAGTCGKIYFFTTALLLSFIVVVIQAHELSEKYRTGTATVVLKNFGELKGYIYEEDGTPPADVFLGVPYAKPPIRTLRFKLPEPPETWHGSTYDATYERQWCVQFWYPDDRLEIRNQSEDCLYLNIIKPHTKSNAPYPVLFWIHGGSYQVGGASTFPINGTVRNIVSRGVIFIAVNYRLGPLGFMSSLSEPLPGNMGLEDQLQALKWIRENIKDFGGDPKNITVGGESAGAACASILAISPRAKGLFHRTVIRSGSSLAPWAVRSINTDLNSGRLIKFLNCTRKNTNWTLRCLQQTPLEHIKKAWRYLAHDDILLIISKSQHKPMNYNHPFLAHTYFTPVVDSFRQNQSIVPMYPEELMRKNAQLPLLIGTTTGECTGYVTWLTYLEKAGTISLQNLDYVVPGIQYSNPEQVKDTVLRHYVTEQMRYKDFDYKRQLVKIASDQNFVAPAALEAKLYASHGVPVYAYSFDYGTADLFQRHTAYGVFDVGAAHGFDMVYLFQSTMVMDPAEKPISWTDDDFNMTNFLSDTVTDFVKFGNPNDNITSPKSPINNRNFSWPPYSSKCPNALLINGSSPAPVIDYYSEAQRFWQDTVGAIQALSLHRSRFDYIYPPFGSGHSNRYNHRNHNGPKDATLSDVDYRLAFYASIAALSVLAFVLIVMCLLHHCGRKDLKAALCETNNIAAKA